MAKAMLIMDMPESCAKCEYHDIRMDGTIRCILCKSHMGECASICGRADWCPLREVPEKEYYGGGWIPCSERLPEITVIGYGDTKMYSEDMLVALRWYDGDVTTETGWYNRKGTWSNDSNDCKVIAWQPLPPAYEPKED